jgi:N-methylhydantoinase A
MGISYDNGLSDLTISIDTGGTFTDVVVADQDQNFTLGKAPTTHERVFLGVDQALESAAEKLGCTVKMLLNSSQLVIYGTTHATNAIVTGSTAKTAFLTTSGFPDILVLREGGKFDPHDFSKEYPEPYIPRRYTYEIEERITATGSVYKPIERAQVNEVIEALRLYQFEACAVCLLWSTVNSSHERQLGTWLSEALPHLSITLSHQLNPTIREYRRASSVAIDASLKPSMQSHFEELSRDFKQKGFRGQILVSTSNGGCVDLHEVSARPLHTVRSGPAMAPVAGKKYSELESYDGPVVVVDTGGTTFDVSLVVDGEISITNETWIGGRFTGHMLGLPAVDARSVGSGGGSIAWIDDAGLLRIGPHSAGADPGPACYAKGGVSPTVTDAAVVLGYIDPAYFLGGTMALDRLAAFSVIEPLAAQLNISVFEAAFSIITVSNELMINAIKDMTVSEGIDPAETIVVAGGGAAGLGILSIAADLNCKAVVIPRAASVLSASGMQYSDIQYERSIVLPARSNAFDYVGVNGVLDKVDEQLEDFIKRMALQGFSDPVISYRVDTKYAAQVWDIPITLPFNRFDNSESIKELVELFHANHRRVFNVEDRASPVEFTNWTGKVVLKIPKVTSNMKQSRLKPTQSERATYFNPKDEVNTPIFRGENFLIGEMIHGPAIIEEPTTTIVVPPGASLHLTESLNYVVHF